MWRGGFIGFLACASLWGAGSAFDQAEKLYRSTEYEGSLQLLLAMPDKNAGVFDLMGRNQYQLGEYKKASESLQLAVNADPSSSEYEHWLGKAFGKRADTA